jgi:hypothetical protein
MNRFYPGLLLSTTLRSIKLEEKIMEEVNGLLKPAGINSRDFLGKNILPSEGQWAESINYITQMGM